MLNIVEPIDKTLGSTIGAQGTTITLMLITTDVCSTSSAACTNDDNTSTNYDAILMKNRDPWGLRLLMNGIKSMYNDIPAFNARGRHGCITTSTPRALNYVWNNHFEFNTGKVQSGYDMRFKGRGVRCVK